MVSPTTKLVRLRRRFDEQAVLLQSRATTALEAGDDETATRLSEQAKAFEKAAKMAAGEMR